MPVTAFFYYTSVANRRPQLTSRVGDGCLIAPVITVCAGDPPGQDGPDEPGASVNPDEP
jgi:hypothetical protein